MGVLIFQCLLICILSGYLRECLAVHITSLPYYSYQPLSPYGIHIRGLDGITFQVKTSKDAHLLLQTYHNSSDVMYEVILGGWHNTQSAIRGSVQGPLQATVKGSVVSEDEYRHFWVSWTCGTITVGRGPDLGADVIMSWTDPSPLNVDYVAVSAWYGVTAEWIFEIPACKEQLKFGILRKNTNFTLSDDRLITADDVTLSRADCSIKCFSKPWCRGFSYGTSGHECNMFDVPPQIEDLEESGGWETWSLVQ